VKASGGESLIAMTLLKHWQITPNLQFAIHLTKCIVKNPPKHVHQEKRTRSLLVPTNPTLTSTTLFSYFQRGGSSLKSSRILPPSGPSSQWGGMEAGSDMVYPVQTIDGLVYIHGGKEYWDALENLRNQVGSDGGARLSEGCGDLPEALTCKAMGQLKYAGYDNLIHVASPVYRDGDSEGVLLRNCYMRGFSGCESVGQTLVMPLIGAGCRGWSVGLAAKAVVGFIEDLARKIDDDVKGDIDAKLDSDAKLGFDAKLSGDIKLGGGPSDVKKEIVVELVLVDKGVSEVVLQAAEELDPGRGSPP